MTKARAPALLFAVFVGLAALALPLGSAGRWSDHATALALWLAALVLAVLALRLPRVTAAGAALAASAAGATALYVLLDAGAEGAAASGLWAGVVALGAIVWTALEGGAALSAERRHRVLGLAVPALFGAWLLYLWQIATVGFDVPSVLLPPPSQIAVAFASSLGLLAEDFVQTFIKSMVPGYIIGCGAGLLVAIVADRVPFLRRGLLPIGNLVSALPIVGVAPIMVMWFGFDWQSKAAVVVIMTFFPMLVNALAGLNALDRVGHDLMRTYAASYGQTMCLARLPAALPFIFNALKVNSTLALIGAIVAEFFGTPIVGMGFRISAEVGRMNIAMVWASIVVAAVTGSLSYGAIALVERSLTFWHPSIRNASS
ncbi:MAG TPA: ABC transporter permease [Alphaproteobacteria bacterium]|nr:ABC transporter permease [Alphaproteobacteria bacterium]